MLHIYDAPRGEWGACEGGDKRQMRKTHRVPPCESLVKIRKSQIMTDMADDKRGGGTFRRTESEKKKKKRGVASRV